VFRPLKPPLEARQAVENKTDQSNTAAQPNVKIRTSPVSAECQVIDVGRKAGKLMQQLVVDDKITLRESDVDRDGKIDHVRVRLSTGEYYILADSDSDGRLDSVKSGP
jgi:hypothetical protein